MRIENILDKNFMIECGFWDVFVKSIYSGWVGICVWWCTFIKWFFGDFKKEKVIFKSI